MKYKIIILILVLTACDGLSAVRFNSTSHSIDTIHIKPIKEDNFSKAIFLLHVPKKVKNPRYILVLVPGFNLQGDRFLKDSNWLKFAEQTNGVILACTFKTMERNKRKFVHYSAAQLGSGMALESAIKKLDNLNPQFSLSELPLLMYGMSAGGQFAYGFSCYNPTRLIGFAAVKGGHYFPAPIDGSYNVPALIISGKKDLNRRRIAIRNLFERGKRNGAPWCWMEDNHGHQEANCLSIIIPYFKELLQMQLTSEQEKKINRSKLAGITVDLTNKKILQEKSLFNHQNTNYKEGWLPSVEVFNIWAKLDTGRIKYTGQCHIDKIK
jgi:poly(3-hydroxybutyrate) depolymerase